MKKKWSWTIFFGIIGLIVASIGILIPMVNDRNANKRKLTITDERQLLLI